MKCYSLAMDKYRFLYITDAENNEVRRWQLGDKGEGTVVAGGNGKGNQLNQLNSPHGLFVDKDGQIYVADRMNNRIMRWSEEKNEGEIVVRGSESERYSNQLSSPIELFFDGEGNLYVSDGVHRIQKFDLIS